jgi:UDP-N-acetylglucosamine 3-dehydrogenase
MELVKETGIAVVGVGYWGAKLVEEYLALSKKLKVLKLHAVVDGSPEALTSIGDKLSLPRSMLKRNIDEVLEDPTITGIHIATPNETHYTFAMKSIASGKNVLLEKPMCLTSSDAFRLARSAEKNNLVLLIGHIFRFNNAINKVKEMYEKGAISGVRCVEMKWTSAMSPPANRDILFDLAPHPIDILNHIFEEWPAKVYAKGHSYERKKVGQEEVAYVTLDFPDNIIASVALSWLHYGPRERTVNIICEKSAVRMEAVEQTMQIFEKNNVKQIPIKRNNTIESEITHFINCIQTNDPPINSALTGIMNVTVLEAMRKSINSSTAIKVIGS